MGREHRRIWDFTNGRRGSVMVVYSWHGEQCARVVFTMHSGREHRTMMIMIASMRSESFILACQRIEILQLRCPQSSIHIIMQSLTTMDSSNGTQKVVNEDIDYGLYLIALFRRSRFPFPTLLYMRYHLVIPSSPIESSPRYHKDKIKIQSHENATLNRSGWQMRQLKHT